MNAILFFYFIFCKHCNSPEVSEQAILIANNQRNVIIFYKYQYILYEAYSCLLTHQMPVLHSYRNQSIDLLCKSNDWFL